MHATTNNRPWVRHYPPDIGPELEFEGKRSVLDLVIDSMKRHPDRAAISCLGSYISYRRLYADYEAMAAWFASLALEPQARVALMMPSCPQYVVCQLALMRAGLVAVNINPLYTHHELLKQLIDSGASAIVVVENFAATVEMALREVKVAHVIVSTLGDMLGAAKGILVNTVNRHIKKAVPSWHLPGHRRYLDVLVDGRKCSPLEYSPKLEDLAMLQYTGGTTGIAKGAMLSQRNLLAGALQIGAFLKSALRARPTIEAPIMLVPLPLYHVFTIGVVLTGLACAARIVLVPNPRDIGALVKTMKSKPFHLMTGLNTLYQALANHPRIGEVDFSACRGFVAGGTATQRVVAERWEALTGRCITEGWGMSETSASGTCNPPSAKTFNGSIGIPLPSTDLSIRDERGRAVPQGEKGEICIAGPQVTSGYWQNPQASAEIFWPDGYLRTGDIGLIDQDGFVHIVDRIKNMVLVSGFNVYPSEIEQVVSRHPGVLEAAAVGVPDAGSGEAVKLFVVRLDANLTIDALRAHCTEHLTNYKRPKQIVFIEELPKSPVGKVLHRELKNI
ncbi:AMP-binding protein [Pseudomonas yamanorum]|uniref:Long-chain-fatty-acid--CoA ligase n=1 Tax=Pseudomonas yamanorum TaxID=515393 RepID=A0A7Y8FEG7_9PSED|nr:AMP-binding protein [Pseudomonas yamanorum]NWE77795.1 AMP-binding protein [Pseudomonas yamanorum]